MIDNEWTGWRAERLPAKSRSAHELRGGLTVMLREEEGHHGSWSTLSWTTMEAGMGGCTDFTQPAFRVEGVVGSCGLQLPGGGD